MAKDRGGGEGGKKKKSRRLTTESSGSERAPKRASFKKKVKTGQENHEGE